MAAARALHRSVDEVFEEIRRAVPGYQIDYATFLTGGAAMTTPPTGPLAGRGRAATIRSSRDTLFQSGTLGRYCGALHAVREWSGAAPAPAITAPPSSGRNRSSSWGSISKVEPMCGMAGA